MLLFLSLGQSHRLDRGSVADYSCIRTLQKSNLYAIYFFAVLFSFATCGNYIREVPFKMFPMILSCFWGFPLSKAVSFYLPKPGSSPADWSWA